MEVAIVLAILALVAALFIPASMLVHENTRNTAIERQVSAASAQARKYMSDNAIRRISYRALVDEGIIQPFVSFRGEDYENLSFDLNGGELTIAIPEGGDIKVRY